METRGWWPIRRRSVEDALSTSPQGTGPCPDGPEVAGLGSLAALTFVEAKLWGHCVQASRSCSFQRTLLKSLLRASSSPAGLSSALQPPKATGAPLVHSSCTAECFLFRGGTPSPSPSPKEERDCAHGVRGVTWQPLPSLWVAPCPEPQVSMCGPSGPGTLGFWVSSGTFSQPC